jgi:hypothetical protein
MEKISSTLEKYIETNLTDLRQIVDENEARSDKWRMNIEDIEAKKFVEIHSAIKVLNTGFQRVSTDNKDRFELI